MIDFLYYCTALPVVFGQGAQKPGRSIVQWARSSVLVLRRAPALPWATERADKILNLGTQNELVRLAKGAGLRYNIERFYGAGGIPL